MSKLTDHLGLTGEKRKFFDKAWANWGKVFDLTPEGQARFMRFMLEKSSALDEGLPPGYAWTEIGKQNDPLDGIFPRTWVRMFGGEDLFDEAERVVIYSRNPWVERIVDGHLVHRDSITREYFVRTRVVVDLPSGHHPEDASPEEIDAAWQLWGPGLGLDKDSMQIFRDLVLEGRNMSTFDSEKGQVDLLFPPPNRSRGQTLIQVSALLMTRPDPDLVFLANAPIHPFTYGTRSYWVEGWRRMKAPSGRTPIR